VEWDCCQTDMLTSNVDVLAAAEQYTSDYATYLTVSSDDVQGDSPDHSYPVRNLIFTEYVSWPVQRHWITDRGRNL